MEAFTGLLLALLVAILSSTIVSNALPTILADLDGTQSQYTWVVTAMLLTSTATTPIWGKLSDLFSKKLLYQLAIVIFTLGSVLGGISQSMPELIAFRALQGVGMGGLQALVQVVIAAMISPRERGRYSGYIGATFAVATVSGPLLGGLIVDSALGWRWCFWVTVPIAVAAFIVLGKTLKLPVVKRDVKIDWLGATLIVGGVALLLIWISLAGKSFDWVSVASGLYIGGAVVALALALFVETRVSEPVVPLRLFRNRTFTLSVIGTLAVGTAMFGGAVFLGQYYQIARGYSPTHAGLMTLPMVLGLFLSSTIAGQVVSRTGKTKPFLVAGSILLTAGLGLLSTIDHATNLTLMGVYLAIMGTGVGFMMQNLVLIVQNTVSMRDMGSASSVVTFFRTLGGSAGVSALGAVLATKVSEQVTAGLAELGVPAGNATSSGGATLDVASLPEPVQEIVRAAYGDATGTLFLVGACISVVTFIAVLLIREQPLRTTLDVDGKDSASQDSADTAVTAVTTKEVLTDPGAASPQRVPSATGTGGRTIAVYGTVTAGDEAVRGAALTLTDSTGQQVGRASTDERGRYLLRAPAEGSYVLITSGGHYRPTASMLQVGSSPVHRDITLSGAGGISGRVRAADRQPLGGARVVLTDGTGEVVASEISGGDGWYRFPNVTGGSYILTASASGYRPVALQVRVTDGEQAGQDVELHPAAALFGTVRSARLGHAVPEAQVTLLDEDGEVVASGFTDREGHYRFSDLARGRYTLITTGYAPTTDVVTVESDEFAQDVALGYPTAVDTTTADSMAADSADALREQG
jgi:EmrB/QacA subfamily drug resistance transporter